MIQYRSQGQQQWGVLNVQALGARKVSSHQNLQRATMQRWFPDRKCGFWQKEICDLKQTSKEGTGTINTQASLTLHSLISCWCFPLDKLKLKYYIGQPPTYRAGQKRMGCISGWVELLFQRKQRSLGRISLNSYNSFLNLSVAFLLFFPSQGSGDPSPLQRQLHAQVITCPDFPRTSSHQLSHL